MLNPKLWDRVHQFVDHYFRSWGLEGKVNTADDLGADSQKATFDLLGQGWNLISIAIWREFQWGPPKCCPCASFSGSCCSSLLVFCVVVILFLQVFTVGFVCDYYFILLVVIASIFADAFRVVQMLWFLFVSRLPGILVFGIVRTGPSHRAPGENCFNMLIYTYMQK